MSHHALTATVSNDATVTVLQIDVPEYLQDTVASFVAFLPRLVGAILILLVGWIVGRIVGRFVRTIADGVELDRMVLETPLGQVLGGTEAAVSRAFGILARWFVYGLAILAAANVLAIPALSRWVETAITYLPAFIAGLAIIILGFVIADFIGDAIMRTRAATETAYTTWFATGTRMFLYFTVIVIGLDTMGIDVGILFVFANAIAWGLAAAVALGAGIAFGWGAHGWVADNIDRWAGDVSSATPNPPGSPQADGGSDPHADGGTIVGEDERDDERDPDG